MATEQKPEKGRSKKAPATAKANGKREIKIDDENNVAEEVPNAQSSISSSHNHQSNGSKSKSPEEKQLGVSGEYDVVDNSAANGTDASKKKNMIEEIEEREKSLLYQFPMNRVSRIIKSEDPSIRITQEAVFVINKASETFVQLFTTEEYANAYLDRKKYIDYKHLSSVTSKRRRFDFLSDFVPEKVKAEDALKAVEP